MAEPSLEQRKKGWDSIAKSYSESAEDNHLPAGITLGKMTHIQSAKNILEVGCGSGILSQYWSNKLSPGTRYTATDLSDEMIRIAQERRDSQKDKGEGVEYVYRSADAENLDFVADDSMDVFISHLCINVVPHPEKAVQEALRVVRKGGRIGISLNTTNDKNFFLKMVRDTSAETGIKEMSLSKPVLGEKHELLKLFQDAGIKVEYCWDQDSAYEMTEDQVIIMAKENPMIKKVLGQLSEDVQAKFADGLRNKFREARNDLIPMKSNFIFVVGSKPE